MQQPSKENIFNAADLPVRSVEVPEWDMTVYVRTIMANEASDISALAPDGKPQPNFFARYAACVLCDEDGQRLFGPYTDTELKEGLHSADIAALGKKPHQVLARIVTEAQKHNGLIADDEDEDEDEDTAKNSEETTD